MFHRTSLLALASCILLAPVARAQQPAAAHRQAGPRIELTATAAHQAHAVRSDSADSSAAVATRNQSMGKPVALMVVGGAAVVLGAVIGDAPGTLFMIGGTVAFLYGLYQYLQ